MTPFPSCFPGNEIHKYSARRKCFSVILSKWRQNCDMTQLLYNFKTCDVCSRRTQCRPRAAVMMPAMLVIVFSEQILTYTYSEGMGSKHHSPWECFFDTETWAEVHRSVFLSSTTAVDSTLWLILRYGCQMSNLLLLAIQVCSTGNSIFCISDKGT